MRATGLQFRFFLPRTVVTMFRRDDGIANPSSGSLVGKRFDACRVGKAGQSDARLSVGLPMLDLAGAP